MWRGVGRFLYLNNCIPPQLDVDSADAKEVSLILTQSGCEKGDVLIDHGL